MGDRVPDRVLDLAAAGGGIHLNNGNVIPIRANWADTAKPFMRDLVMRLESNLTMDELTLKLSKLTPPRTPKDFLVDSLLNVLAAATGNNWAIAMFNDKLREDAVARADELANLYGGYEPAIMGLIKQDLGAIQQAMK
jgi:hypothetical protein